jgi:hypothetical protein
MEEKTGKELKFDIDIVFLNELEDIIEEGSKIFPIKEKIVLEGNIKYHKKFIRRLKTIQTIKKAIRKK